MTAFLRLNRSLLSPLFAFCAAWVAGAYLSQFHLLAAQTPWSGDMALVVLAVPIAFLAGGLIGEAIAVRLAAERTERRPTASSTRFLRLILVAFLLVGLLELVHQFVKIGGIPLLAPDGNKLRFEQGGPTIVLTDLLTVAAIVALVRPENPFARESWFELGVATAALTGFALQAGRGSLILPIVVATAARWLYWGRPRAAFLGGAALITFAAIVFGFYLRTKQSPGNPFEAELYGEILPDTPFYLQPLIPLHLAITTNFLALQGIVAYFPNGEPFGHGVFNTLALNQVFDNAQSLNDVSARITPPWVTSTVAGPFWADGGWAALIPGIAATGGLSAGAFAMARRTRSLRWSMVAAYLLYLALFGLYTNLWTQQIDWVLIAPALLVVGAVAENPTAPPGITGWAWARIRRVLDRNEEQVDEPREPIELWKGDPKVALRLLAAGIGIMVVLAVFGLAVQRAAPDPYGLTLTKQLPPSSAEADSFMTDGDHSLDNEPLRWLVATGGVGDTYAYRFVGARGGVRSTSGIPLPSTSGPVQRDVSHWSPWQSPVLFTFEQERRRIAIRMQPIDRRDGRPLAFNAPVSPPPKAAVRDLQLATWDGPRPDLFVITRGRETSRPLLQILSGESGFTRQVFIFRLPYRGIGPDRWAVDVSQVAGLPRKDENRTVAGERPDVVLIHHDPDKEHADIQVLLGESGFEWNAFRRDFDAPGKVPSDTKFLVGSLLGAPALYEVAHEADGGRRFQVYGIATPAAFK
ncbi:MAG TPA: O-antigen polymerase [Solirubrobacterales bacterium]